MATRQIRKTGDEVLRKVAKQVEKIDDKILSILRDMAETLKKSDGIGLAATQVGIMKRLVVIDIKNDAGLIELINPRILSESGEQIYTEGCLSVPGVFGDVKRPAKIVIEALNAKGEKINIEAGELLAVVISHEIDHLNGILFTDKAIRIIDDEDSKKTR